MTRQRRALLDAVQREDRHPTADEVHRAVRRRLPRISLGTVYRNLELLVEQGLLRKLDLGGGQRRFDAKPGPHYHVRCTRCGRVEDVRMRPLPAVERAAARATGYEVTEHHLEFVGRCGECRNAVRSARD
jgi:Fur family ferric uptake transcriptional regulator